MPLKILALALLFSCISSLSTSYAADTPNLIPTEETAATKAIPQTAPDISGVYRLKSSERVNLTGGEDPLKDNKIFKGKWIVEKLDANTFLIFKAESVRNSRTLEYVSIYEFVDGAFVEKLHHLESTAVANVSIRFDEGILTTELIEDDTFQETNQWKRINPTEEKKTST